MRLLIISDLHAHNDVLDKMDEVFKQADAVVFGGDFAECFKPETGAEALKPRPFYRAHHCVRVSH